MTLLYTSLLKVGKSKLYICKKIILDIVLLNNSNTHNHPNHHGHLQSIKIDLRGYDKGKIHIGKHVINIHSLYDHFIHHSYYKMKGTPGWTVNRLTVTK